MMGIGLLIVIGLIFFLFLRNRKQRRTYLSNHTVLWLLGGYITVLIACGIVSSFMPDDKGLAMAKNSNPNIIPHRIYGLALDGKIKEINPSFVREKWKKIYSSQQLHIELQGTDSANITIFVEHKKVNDHKIEGTFYQSNFTFNNFAKVDVSRLIPSPKFSWHGDILTIRPVKKKITFSLFNKDFPINQFTKSTGVFDDQTSMFGEQLLYLRVPKGLHVLSNNNLDVEDVLKK